MKLRLSSAIGVSFSLLLLPLSVYSASFSCGKKLTVVEGMICNDYQLARKDLEMVKMYKELLRRDASNDDQELRQHQREWLVTRNSCSTMDCVRNAYSDRIKDLKGLLDSSYEKNLPRAKCSRTKISDISSRLGTDEGSGFVAGDPKEVGTAITYSNGVYSVSYEYVPAISERSRIGDPVEICLISVYVKCPKGDDRGHRYSGRNLRTGETWDLYDSQHVCGGA